MRRTARSASKAKTSKLQLCQQTLEETESESDTNLVMVDGDTNLIKIIPMPSKATTEYAAARVN